jgi:hypothetical protein
MRKLIKGVIVVAVLLLLYGCTTLEQPLFSGEIIDGYEKAEFSEVIKKFQDNRYDIKAPLRFSSIKAPLRFSSEVEIELPEYNSFEEVHRITMGVQRRVYIIDRAGRRYEAELLQNAPDEGVSLKMTAHIKYILPAPDPKTPYYYIQIVDIAGLEEALEEAVEAKLAQQRAEDARKEADTVAKKKAEVAALRKAREEEHKKPPVFAGTVAQFRGEFEANKYAADQKYRDKIVSLTGTITDLKQNASIKIGGELDLPQQAGTSVYGKSVYLNGFFCIFLGEYSLDDSVFLNLRKGQTITIVGRFVSWGELTWLMTAERYDALIECTIVGK